LITRDDLAAAVDEGVLTEMQAAALIARAESRAGAADVDDERFRFFNGFNDVFLALGILLVGMALGIFQKYSHPPLDMIIAAIAVVVLWLLGEVVIRRKRAVLPSIFISVLIMMFAFALLNALAPGHGGGREIFRVFPTATLTGTYALLPFMIVFYLRFRLPFTLGTIAMVAYACGLVTLWRFGGAETLAGWVLPLTLGAGFAIFAAAVAYDFSDPGRVTRRADCAFWLHLTAAPMITHGLMSGYVARLDSGAVTTMLLGFAVLAIVSLALDRRAPLVSALIYLGISIGYLFTSIQMSSWLTYGVTLLLVGAVVVTMGLAWRPLRRALLSPFRRLAFVRRLPPLHPA